MASSFELGYEQPQTYKQRAQNIAGEYNLKRVESFKIIICSLLAQQPVRGAPWRGKAPV